MKPYFRYALIFIISCLCTGQSFAQLQAGFVMDKPGGCSPLVVNFTNTTTGAGSNAVYDWDFGNGNSSGLPNGGAIYTLEQSYSVTLTVTDNGKKSSITQQVVVYKPPTVDFSSSVTKGCLPLSVTFTSGSDPGSGNISNYTWDFGDGNTVQGATASQMHTYTVVQDPIVSLTVTNSNGCHTTKQKTNLVDVLPGVTANITADKNFLCLISDAVQFNCTSTGPGTLSYTWDFGDGNGSTQKNPKYVFNKKGIYTVKLQVTSSDGCVANTALSNFLNVASFTTDFTVPAPLCVGSVYNLTNSSSPAPDNSSWYYDGSLYYNGFASWLNAYASGSHTITLTNTFGGCTQTQTKNIVVNDLPSPAGFSYVEQSKCGPPETVVFTDLSNATKHEWDFQYNNYGYPNIMSTLKQPSHDFPDQGIYNIWLRSTNDAGCSVSSYQSIYLSPPYINISSNSPAYTCVTPNTQKFSIYPANTTFSSFTWNFGDGTTSTTDLSPTHIYTVPGDYSVFLTYTTTDGCSGVSNLMVCGVSSMPVVDFTTDKATVCGNNPVNISATNTQFGSSWIWYDWTFGDGTQNSQWGWGQVHQYAAPGKYSVSLTVSNMACTTTTTKTDFITVLPPYINYNYHANTCSGDRGDVSFFETATDATSLLWDFGDGTTATTPGDQTTVTHHYAKDGNFMVTVQASNDQNGCTLNPIIDQVVVFHKPKPNLTADKTSVCTSDILRVNISDANLNQWVGGYRNSFYPSFIYGDGTPFYGSVIQDYNNTDVYTGTLTNFDKSKQDLRVITTSTYYGCSDTSNLIPLKIKGLVPAFTIVQNNPCFQSPVILKDASLAEGGNSVVSWLWNFNDGSSPVTTPTASHVYAHPGTYLVQLTVKDAGGCSATTTNYSTGYVSANGPEALFSTSGNNVSLNSTVNFYNNSNTNGSYNTVYTWTISDGTTTTDYSFSHTFPVPGDYTVTLAARDLSTGCSSTTSQKIHVSNFNSAFTFSKSYVSGECPPVLVNFNNTSLNYSGVKWDFGDGSTADNLNNVSHVYKDPGKYIITLSVFAPNGLQGQFIDSVIIKTPSSTLAAKPLQACIGATIQDTAISLNASTYTWDFGDGSIVSTSIPVSSHQYAFSGIYHPELLVQDENGCSTGTKMPGEINIHPNPVPLISPGNTAICLGSNLALVADGGSTYKWFPATGLSNDAISSPIATPLVTTTYQLQIADDLGCQNSTSVTITVIKPSRLIPGNDTTVCEGNTVQLKASGKSVYTWINNTEGLDNTGIPNPVARPSSTVIYTVTGTNDNNCFPETAEIAVQVLPLPMVNAGLDTTLQAGTSFHLNGTGSNDIIQWNWTPDKYLDCSDCATPLCKPMENMVYTLTAKSENGCYASSQVKIKMECDAAKISIPNAFTPNRDGKNDLFIIHGISFVKHMTIFDRWGNRVFEKNNFNPADPASCWNGQFNGMDVVSGTYVYFIEMQCPSGEPFSRKGSVVLIR